MSIPTQRTLLMLSIYFGAALLRRRVGIWQGLGLALLLVLLLDPFAPMAVGFWLSFGAVAVILLNVSGRLGKERLLSQYIRVQWVVTLGLAPTLLCAFGNLSLISPWVNLLAIPAFTLLIVPASLLGTLLAIVHPAIGVPVLHASADFLERVYAALQWSASLPLATWHFPQAPGWGLVLLALGMPLLVAPSIGPVRLAGLLLCLPALAWQPPQMPEGSFSLTMLDVGQGLAVVVATRDKALLYDTGPAFRSGRDTGEMVILPYLHAVGIRRLNVIVVSHGDEDHAGGLATVAREMSAERILVGPSVRARLAGTELCRRGLRWRWNEVDFTLLHPSRADDSDTDNNSSCVLRVESRGGSALLLGDIEKPAEERLLAAGLLSHTDIVVAAHHGSRSSSSEAFVQAVKARYVLFSAGYRNRWGFPKPGIVQRWAASGARGYSTIPSGAVALSISAEADMTVSEYRSRRRRYWSAD